MAWSRLFVVFIRCAGGPIDEVTTELRFDLAHSLVAEEIVEIEEADQQQIMRRPRPLVVLILGAFRNLVRREYVSYSEGTRISCPDCGGVPSPM